MPVPTGTRPDVTSPERTVTQTPGFASSTAGNVLGSVNEWTDGMVRSVDAAMRGGIGSIAGIRFRRSYQ